MAFNLCIDVGNSRTKFALFKGNELSHVAGIANHELDKNNTLFNEYDLKGVIISSVNKKAEDSLQLNQYKLPLLKLNPSTPIPISLEYESVDTLGKDRIAAVVGAQPLFKGHNILVIDAGTCVTYDLLTSQKVYLGGAISPGIQMRLKAMNQYTDQLPFINWIAVDKPKTIGNTTISSMLSGAVNGLISEINGIILDYKKQFPELKIVLTGGDTNFFEKALKKGIFADQNLVLKGLNEILIYNQG